MHTIMAATTNRFEEVKRLVTSMPYTVGFCAAGRAVGCHSREPTSIHGTPTPGLKRTVASYNANTPTRALPEPSGDAAARAAVAGECIPTELHQFCSTPSGSSAANCTRRPARKRTRDLDFILYPCEPAALSSFLYLALECSKKRE